jgi:hypothetical protein
MFSSQYSGELLPCREEVVAEKVAVGEVEVEVGEVEDHLEDRTQPSSQWRQLLMFMPWERNPKTSLGIKRKPTTSLRK